jgi:hypothetical protein
MIKTKASAVKNVDQVNVVKFVERKKTHRIPKYFPKEEEIEEKSQSDQEFDEIFSDDPPRKKAKEDKNEFSFQKARRDIFNFAVGGFEKKEEKDAKIKLAIKLGLKIF